MHVCSFIFLETFLVSCLVACDLQCENNFEPLPDCSACDCSFPFYGPHCELESTECEPSPCLNGGTCTSSDFNSFKCNCTPNFEGELCEICALPYCKECTQEDGVCRRCIPGFVLNSDGQCGKFCTQPFTPSPLLCNKTSCELVGSCTVSLFPQLSTVITANRRAVSLKLAAITI